MSRFDLRCRLTARWQKIIAGFAAIVLGGCIQEMADQPRIEPYESSSFFDDGRASRQPVEGTVARGQLKLDDHFHTGMVDGKPAAEFPPRLLEDTSPEQLLARGQERFNIFCSHCHGQVGGGLGGDAEYESLVGMVAKRGFPMPPTFHQPRLRETSVGHLFDVITRGIGRMPAHDYLVPPADRWAIVTHIRALQLSQHAPVDDLDIESQQALSAAAAGNAP